MNQLYPLPLEVGSYSSTTVAAEEMPTVALNDAVVGVCLPIVGVTSTTNVVEETPTVALNDAVVGV